MQILGHEDMAEKRICSYADMRYDEDIDLILLPGQSDSNHMQSKKPAQKRQTSKFQALRISREACNPKKRVCSREIIRFVVCHSEEWGNKNTNLTLYLESRCSG